MGSAFLVDVCECMCACVCERVKACMHSCVRQEGKGRLQSVCGSRCAHFVSGKG